MGVPVRIIPENQNTACCKNEKWIVQFIYDTLRNAAMNVLCLKLRNRHAVWNPAAASYYEDGQAYSIPTDGQNADKIRRIDNSASKEYSWVEFFSHCL